MSYTNNIVDKIKTFIKLSIIQEKQKNKETFNNTVLQAIIRNSDSDLDFSKNIIEINKLAKDYLKGKTDSKKQELKSTVDGLNLLKGTL